VTHWMTSETRDGAPIPAMILRRWQWFHDNAQRARRGYLVTELTAICCAAAVPVAAGLRLHPVVLALLGAGVIVATGIRTTFGLHENWVEFIRMRYDIERECALYLVGAAPYETEAAKRHLVVRIETLAATHSTSWADRRTRQASVPPPATGDAQTGASQSIR
jgi:Protein of unknown function (DUF4231)